MRAAFIPALPPSALLAGMIAPSFRLVNRFCGKKLLRTCGRRERPPALCAVWARSPLAYVLLRTCGRHERPPALCAVWARSPLACGRVPYPPYARYGMGRLCGERRRREHCERPCGARNAPRRTPQLSPPGHAPPHRPAETPLHAPAPATVGASPRPPLAPWVRASPAPAARERFECPKARREACALWALGPKAQSDPKRGSETMSATGREARMIEQPGARNAPRRTP